MSNEFVCVCWRISIQQLIPFQLAKSSGMWQVWRGQEGALFCSRGCKRPAKRRMFPEKPRHLLSVRREHREESRD